MNWQYLRYFEVAAREEHFTRAAEKLHMTQSALSKSISNLEKEIGLPLFEQQGRNMKLTRYGQIFYNHVTSATAEVETGLNLIQNMAGASAGEVYFAVIFSAGATLIPKLVKGFREKHTDIKLKFTQHSTADILNNVLEGYIDLGICGEFPKEGYYKDIGYEVIQVEELLLAVPENHRLAGQDSVELKEILNETFIGYTDNTGIIYSIQETLNRAGLKDVVFTETYQAAEDNTVASMVREGMGVAFIADNPVVHRHGLKFLNIKNPFFSRKIYLVWRKNASLSPAAKAFKYYILSSMPEESIN